MKIFNIFQIDIMPLIDTINANGWENAGPVARAHCRVSAMGAKGYEPDMASAYKLVGFVEADDMEAAFMIGNGAKEGKIERVAERMSSLSVGNVLVDVASGDSYLIDCFGFEEIDFNP